MMATSKVHFAKYVERLKPGVSLHKEVEVCGSQSLSRIGKKAVQKIKEHASSESHLRQVEAELIVSRGETVVHQLQCFGDSERSKNRKAIKALLGCTHYLFKQHIPHTSNLSKLIDLIVSCGGKDLEEFVRKAAKNASYTSTDAVTDFVEAIGVWVDELQVNRVRNAPFFSLMADECVDVANIEELSVYCRWVENGVPVEHFMEILPLKKTNAQSIYLRVAGLAKEEGFAVQ